MSDSRISLSSADAVTQAQVRENKEAIAAALSSIEEQLALLAKLDAQTRRMGLQETSRVCNADGSEAERKALSALQGETNAAFAQLRRTFYGLQAALIMLSRDTVPLDSAAHGAEQDCFN